MCGQIRVADAGQKLLFLGEMPLRVQDQFVECRSQHLAGGEVLGATLDELILYTKRHFAEEEQFLAGFRYPELASHAAVHRSMTDKVIALRNGFQRDGVANTVEIFEFLRTWLSDHILRSDLAYARHYHQRG